MKLEISECLTTQRHPVRSSFLVRLSDSVVYKTEVKKNFGQSHLGFDPQTPRSSGILIGV